ncbi:MAG: TlyA family RNA methyltransferase [Caldilineaceae bacterium]|nr:TlyA family RNA methyltransferase [Caldilineaceae bacterium]
MSASDHALPGSPQSKIDAIGSSATVQNGARKQRLDLLLVERDLAESREKARRLIMAGDVLVNEQVWDKPGRAVPAHAEIRVRATLPFVSRGGVKLAAALDAFQLDVADVCALDVGASTGGFTDCLLQRGARLVYAVDVGYGQLAWKLRSDPRVVVLERTNIRHLDALPLDPNGRAPHITLAVIDASFISLELVLPPTLHLMRQKAESKNADSENANGENANIVALIKPQFEAGKENVGKGGVVRDQKVHRSVLQETLSTARNLGLVTRGVTVSPLLGPAGNVEFLVWWQQDPSPAGDLQNDLLTTNIRAMIEQTLAAAHALRQGAG